MEKTSTTSSEMKVLEFLSPQEKKSLFMFIITCLPPEICGGSSGSTDSGVKDAKESIPVEYRMTWSFEVLCTLCKVLGVSESYIEMYLPLVLAPRIEGCSDAERIDNLSKSFDKEISALGDHKRTVLVEVMALFMVLGKYDARGRVLCRNMSKCLHLAALDFQIAEYYFRLFFAEVAAQEAVKKEGKPKSKMARYAKVGLASVGAGAVIALTGGLAAPAIAGALFLTLGSTTIAAAATTTTIATLFGGAGAGLTGYKMMRRTRGVEEFEFEQYEGSGQLAMIVMVSGWIEEPEDYKRSFGIPSDQMGLEELLTRYYQEHSPENLSNVDKEVAQYAGLDEEAKNILFETLNDVFGADPRKRENLVPAFKAPEGAEESEFRDTFTQAIQRVFNLSETTAAARDSINNITSEHVHVSSVQTKGTPSCLTQERPNSVANEHCVGAYQDYCSSTVAAADLTAENNVGLSISKTVGTTSTTVAKLGKEESDIQVTTGLDGNGAVVAIKDHISLNQNKNNSDADEKQPSTVGAEQSCVPEDEKADLNIKKAETVGRIASKKYWHWRHTRHSNTFELYVLKWETELQLELGSCIRQMVTDLQNAAVQKAVATAFFSALASAVMLPALLLKLTDVIDSLWTIATERADAAGVELAEALLSRPHGSKPVTLVGYSMGARLIFSCLKELSNRLHFLEGQPPSSLQADSDDDFSEPCRDGGASVVCSEERALAAGGGVSIVDNRSTDKNARLPQSKKEPSFFSSIFKSKSSATFDADAHVQQKQQQHGSTVKSTIAGAKSRDGAVLHMRSLIEDVVLLGVPVSATSKTWAAARGIVCGRFINGYCKDDLVLSILYRFQRFKKDVGGIAPISCTPGIENIDLSCIVRKHSDYCRNMQEILAVISLGK